MHKNIHSYINYSIIMVLQIIIKYFQNFQNADFIFILYTRNMLILFTDDIN